MYFVHYLPLPWTNFYAIPNPHFFHLVCNDRASNVHALDLHGLDVIYKVSKRILVYKLMFLAFFFFFFIFIMFTSIVMVVVIVKIKCFLSINTRTGSFTILNGLFLHVGGDFVLLEMDLQTHLSRVGLIHYINFLTSKFEWLTL